MIIFALGVIFWVAVIYHGINFILLFKQSLPIVIVGILTSIAFLVALPFVPYTSIIATWGKINKAYTIILFMLYSLFMAMSITGFYYAIYP